MNWLLVAIVAGSPVPTNLTFPSLNACMATEAAMRKEQTDSINAVLKSIPAPDDKTRDFWFSRAASGICIPTK